jgi:hypothetical protein
VDRTKALLTFLDESDEANLWAELKSETPRLLLIDGSRWRTPDPPVVESPGECANLEVFLWDPGVAATLPSRQRGDFYDGPRSGLVIEWSRCRFGEAALLSGRFAAGFDTGDRDMTTFVSTVFARVMTSTGNRLRRLDGTAERAYRIGPSAMRAATGGMALRDRSVPVEYKVE